MISFVKISQDNDFDFTTETMVTTSTSKRLKEDVILLLDLVKEEEMKNEKVLCEILNKWMANFEYSTAISAINPHSFFGIHYINVTKGNEKKPIL